MKSLIEDLFAFFVAIWGSWIALMSGIFSVVFWAAGATVEPATISIRLAFLLFGLVAMLAAAFFVWRQEREKRKQECDRVAGRETCLWLIRTVEEGKQRMEAYDSLKSDPNKSLRVTADLQAWYTDTMTMLEKTFADHWHHFADIGSFTKHGTEGERSQVELLLKRMSQLLDIIKPKAQQ
jgi:hypothetical protein